jgi:PRTRC genetic system ThiF family protein
MNTLPLPDNWIDRPVTIALVGAGGTGSQLADALGSLQATLMALGHPGFNVAVFDPDTVSESNLGRQRFTRSDIGHAKAVLLCHRINAFYGVDWSSRVGKFPIRDASRFDLILTCTDKAKFRAELAQAASRESWNRVNWWLDCGNASATGQVVLGQLNGRPCDQRIPHVVDLFPEQFTPEGIAAADADDTPSCGAAEALARQQWPVNRVAAQIASELLWSWFRHGRITHHGAQFQLDPMRIQPLPIDPKVWACFGYVVLPTKKTRTTPKKTSHRQAA